ncbi:DNA polymerase IV [Sulfolobales archaeon HS-7]|nr:DNA polymerase IV [Sulfolobales archaeon HS-7]
MILFVDFDYFYVQVEEVENPSLRGKPVAVCVFSGRNEISGAVATANYEARKLGVKSGIPISRAIELGGDSITLLPMRKDLYRQYSSRIMNIIAKYGRAMEVASIDEAYLDIGNVSDREAEEIGRKLKEAILGSTGIRVTVGIGQNKVIAKIAADRSKPDGLMVVKNTAEFLQTVAISEVPGIGDTLARKLEEAGVVYLRDITNFEYTQLRKLIGSSKARYLFRLATNTYNEPVRQRERKSYNRILTLKKNSRDLDDIFEAISIAIDEVYLKANGLPKEVGIILIMEDLDLVTRSITKNRGIPKTEARNVIRGLLMKLLNEDKRKVRRAGVKISKVTNVTTLDDFLGDRK